MNWVAKGCGKITFKISTMLPQWLPRVEDTASSKKVSETVDVEPFRKQQKNLAESSKSDISQTLINNPSLI